MKIKILIVVLFLNTLFFSSCQKQNTTGDILIKVSEDGKSVDQPVLFIKSGTKVNPNIPLDQYERSTGGDSSGEAYVRDLPLGDYFVFVEAYSTSSKKVLNGEHSFTITKNTSFNVVKLNISLQK